MDGKSEALSVAYSYDSEVGVVAISVTETSLVHGVPGMPAHVRVVDLGVARLVQETIATMPLPCSPVTRSAAAATVVAAARLDAVIARAEARLRSRQNERDAA